MSATDGKERIYRKTTHGILWNLFGKNVGFILSFIFTILIARELGPSEYGDYSFYRNTAAFLALFTILGLDQTMIHFIPALRQRGDGGMLPGLMRKTFERIMTGTVIMIVLSLILFSIVPDSYGWDYAFPGRIMVLFIGVLIVITISGLFRGVMAGLFRQRDWNIVETVSIISKLLMALLFLWLGYGLEGVLLAVVISYTFPSIIYYRMSKQELSQSERIDSTGRTWSDMKRYSLTMLIFTASYIMLDNQIDIIMLKFLSGNSEAGHYNIAFRFAFISAMVIVGAIDGVLVPAFTSLGSRGRNHQRSTLRSSLRFTMFFLIPLSIAGMLFSDQLIRVFFGDEYESAVPMLQVFYGTLVISIALAWPLRFLMISIGLEQRILRLYVAYGMLNVAGNILLIPLYDGFGAVIATGATSWMITLHLMFEVKRHGMLEFPGWFSLKSLMAACIASAPFLYVLGTGGEFNGILMLAFVYVIFCTTYLIMILLMKGITIDEIQEIKGSVLGAKGQEDNLGDNN